MARRSTITRRRDRQSPEPARDPGPPSRNGKLGYDPADPFPGEPASRSRRRARRLDERERLVGLAPPAQPELPPSPPEPVLPARRQIVVDLEPEDEETGAPVRPPKPPLFPPGRLVSLDAFRGLTILGMLLVNNVALDRDTPAQLTHAPWNGGVRLADLVFPWFLLIVGVAIPYAAASEQRKGRPGWRHDLRLAGRAAALFALGCLLESSVARRPVFALGVLQLIALAYFGGALLYDLPLRRRLSVAGGLLVAHWAAIRFLPVPGAGIGVFTEEQNWISHVNSVYLAPYGLRGLLSVVPTTALVLIGTAAGDLLRSERLAPLRRLAVLGGGGLVLVCLGRLWSLSVPFNKPLWTSSYILFAAGWGAVTLGALYAVADVRGWRWWAYPLVVFGSNSIVAYVAPILVKLHFLREWGWRTAGGGFLTVQDALQQACADRFGHIGGGWVYTLGYILAWWLALFWLYRRRVFLRV
jgi:predicted acyltransferase